LTGRVKGKAKVLAGTKALMAMPGDLPFAARNITQDGDTTSVARFFTLGGAS
jgi:hypothetical protein